MLVLAGKAGRAGRTRRGEGDGGGLEVRPETRPRDLTVRWARSKEPPSTGLSVSDIRAGRSAEGDAGDGPHEPQRSGWAFGRTSSMRLRAGFALALANALCACCGATSGAAGTPSPAQAVAEASPSPAPTAAAPSAAPGPTRLVALQSLDELKQRFNQDQGTPRLVLLFSPT